MDYTSFAGLTELVPGDALESDGGSFLYRNPQIIDFLLELGVVRHRHNAHPALAVPTLAPDVAESSGGALPTDTTYFIGYTLVDEYGGETTVSPIAEITTRAGLDAPEDPPVAAFQAAGGPMPGGAYYYAITVVDTAGGESTLGEYAFVDVPFGLASGQVVVSGLAAMVGDGASWRLYRSFNGAEWGFLAGGTADTYIDDCSDCVDATLAPPVNAPTTGDSRLEVTVPAPSAGVSSFRLYASEVGDLANPSLVGTYPVSSAGQPIVVTDANFRFGSPPPVSLAKPGANQIDPDTELLDWHWKRPVASTADLGSGAPGDVRLVLSTGTLYGAGADGAAGPSDWSPVSAGAGGDGFGGLAWDFAQLLPIWLRDANVWGAGREEKDERHSASITMRQVGNGEAFVAVDDFSVDHLSDPFWYDWISLDTGATLLPGTPTGPWVASGSLHLPRTDYGNVLGSGYVGLYANMAAVPGLGKFYGDFMLSMKFNDWHDSELLLGVRGLEGQILTAKGGQGPIGIWRLGEDGTQVGPDAAGWTNVNPSWLVLRRVGTVITAERWLTDPTGIGSPDDVVTIDADDDPQFSADRMGSMDVWLQVAGHPDGGTTFDDLRLAGERAVDAIDIRISNEETGADVSARLLDENGMSSLELGGVRSTITHNVTLASGAMAAPNIPIPMLGWQLLRVGSNRPTRVRLYATRAQRDLDAGRAVGTDPDSGHGLLAEVVTTVAVPEILMSPGAVGANMEAVPAREVAANITNLDTASGAVSVDLTFIPTEA